MRSTSNGYVMALATPGEDHVTEGGNRLGRGLVAGHAYSLLKVAEVDGHELCRIRNPWGKFEWAGDWSDSSPLWTPERRAMVGIESENKDDGIFWMSFQDVLTRFESVNICHVRHPGLNSIPWKVDRKDVVFKFNQGGHGVESVTMFKITIGGEGAEMYATVHQPDKRRIGTAAYFDIGVTILKETAATGQYHFIASSGNSVDRQNQLEIFPGTLSSGTYLVIPTSTGCRIESERQRIIQSGKALTDADVTRTAVLSIHSE
jgi:hypothetical protein